MAATAPPTVMPSTAGAVGGIDSTPVPPTAPAGTTTESTPATDTITSASDTAAAATATKDEIVGKGEANVEGSPATEGVLGYKGPGLIQ